MAVVGSPSVDVEGVLVSDSLGATLGLVDAVGSSNRGDVGVEVLGGNAILHDNDVGVGDDIVAATVVEESASIDGSDGREEDGDNLDAAHFEGVAVV